jgi:hypothetical protein
MEVVAVSKMMIGIIISIILLLIGFLSPLLSKGKFKKREKILRQIAADLNLHFNEEISDKLISSMNISIFQKPIGVIRIINNYMKGTINNLNIEIFDAYIGLDVIKHFTSVIISLPKNVEYNINNIRYNISEDDKNYFNKKSIKIIIENSMIVFYCKNKLIDWSEYKRMVEKCILISKSI